MLSRCYTYTLTLRSLDTSSRFPVIGNLRALAAVSKIPISDNRIKPVSHGGWVTLCSSWITVVKKIIGWARHPFTQAPPVTGFRGPIRSFISGFPTLTIPLSRGVYHTDPGSHTASTMSSPRVEGIHEVPSKGPFVPFFIDSVLTFSR